MLSPSYDHAWDSHLRGPGQASVESKIHYAGALLEGPVCRTYPSELFVLIGSVLREPDKGITTTAAFRRDTQEQQRPSAPSDADLWDPGLVIACLLKNPKKKFQVCGTATWQSTMNGES